MSQTAENIEDSGAGPVGVKPPERARSDQRTLWAWATVACLLLGASGVIRTVQDRRHQVESQFDVTYCPFKLNDLPPKLGVWRAKEGSDQVLDPLTMRTAGGTHDLIRTYVDELTGVSLVVLVLFGPAEPVLPHTPEICYPSSGYSGAQDSMTRTIKFTTQDPAGLDVKREALFRSAVFEKSGGLSTRREEAYYSFRLDGQWSPDVGAGRKFPRRNPGIFKLQIQRWVAAGENRERDNPTEQFLSSMIPEIERRIAAGSTAGRVAGR